MRHLTIGDLKLILRDMLGDQIDDLRASATGQLYEPRLRAKKKAIDALPDAVISGTPFAEELAEADLSHDGIGGAVFYFCQAITLHPGLSPEVKQAAENARATFVPQLSNLREPFADEAAQALSNRPKLAQQKAALKGIEVPGGGSLFDWVKDFLDAGDAIDVLLRRRANAILATEDASGTAALRGSALGLLTRFRDALRDEVNDPDSELPADHEPRLFAYFDKLAADRTAAKGIRETDSVAETAPAPAGESTVAPATPA